MSPAEHYTEAERLLAASTEAGEWLREPGVSGAEVFPWLYARAGIELKTPDTEDT